MRTLPLLLLTACLEGDGETVYEDDHVDGGAPPELDEPGVDLSDLVYFDCIQVEFRRWGEELDRCRVEIGFVSGEDESHGDPPRGDDEEREEVRIGECTVEYEEPADDGGGGPGPGPEGPSTGIDVGPTLTLRGDDGTLALVRYNPEEGGVLYQLQGCDEESFPFGAVMDLEVPGSEATGMPAFVVEDAVWFPGRSGLLAPEIAAEADGRHSCPAGADLEVSWLDDDPAGADLGSWMNLTVETSDGGREQLRCDIAPDDTGLTVPSEALDALTGLDEDPDARHDLRLGRTLEGPDTALPWGTTMRSRVSWELSGELALRGE